MSYCRRRNCSRGCLRLRCQLRFRFRSRLPTQRSHSETRRKNKCLQDKLLTRESIDNHGNGFYCPFCHFLGNTLYRYCHFEFGLQWMKAYLNSDSIENDCGSIKFHRQLIFALQFLSANPIRNLFLLPTPPPPPLPL